MTSTNNPIEEMLLQADRILRTLDSKGVHLDSDFRGLMYDPETKTQIPASTQTSIMALHSSVAAVHVAASGGYFFYVEDTVQAVIDGALVDAPTMFYEPHLVPKGTGWMKFSRPMFTDKEGETYDIVIWTRENEWLFVVWMNRSTGLMNYTMVMEQAPVADHALQVLFVALHVIAQPVVGTEDYQVNKPGHGRRKLNVKPTLIRKIVLRRIVHPHQGGEHDEEAQREYHCRWMVQSHWRQQPYRSTGDVRPRLIAAYVKGPEGKPLKPPTTNIFIAKR
jgi:hypothetical protein